MDLQKLNESTNISNKKTNKCIICGINMYFKNSKQLCRKTFCDMKKKHEDYKDEPPYKKVKY